MRNRLGSAPLALLFAATLVGCGGLHPPKATVSVADLEAAFPTIERLSAVVYMYEAGDAYEPDCEYFEYARGAFTSTPTDEFCRVFDVDDRHPGGGDEGPVPVAFDAQARADLAELKSAFEPVHARLDYLNLVLLDDGTLGPDSVFQLDRCVGYWYQPGWTALPEDESGDSVSAAIDRDWYKTDGCQ